MTTPEISKNSDDTKPAGPAPFILPEEITKYSVRKAIWIQLNKARLVNFPFPCWGRIPNFKGASEAGKRLIELECFKKSSVVKVNPDKPQEIVRLAVLQDKKTLLVPTPRLKEGLLNVIVPNIDGEEGTQQYNRKLQRIVTRSGMEQNGKPFDLNSNMKIDLIVMGSVVVSKQGYRVGKGEGFSDLEIAILMRNGVIDQDTLIVTTVHDNQIFDELPSELMEPHDVPVDIIVTPTQVIYCPKRLKPTNIIWNQLSERRISLMPILKELREKDEESGKDVCLKEVDSDAEMLRRYRPRRFRPFYQRQNYGRWRGGDRRQTSQSENVGGESTAGTDGENVDDSKSQRRFKRFPPRRNRQQRINRQSTKMSDIQSDFTLNDEISPIKLNGAVSNNDDAKDGQNNNKNKRRNAKQKRKQGGRHYDISLRLSNIDQSSRVRDLKLALQERNVKPNLISWCGTRGYCYLHFKSTSTSVGDTSSGIGMSEFTDVSTTVSKPDLNDNQVDKIVESLKELKLSSNVQKALVVEPVARITRIETTGVTTV